MGSDPEDDGRRHGGQGPASGDFDRIVASWRAEGAVPVWPDDDAAPGSPARPAADDDPDPVHDAGLDPAHDPGPLTAAWRPHGAPPPEEEHYVPPEPPPLPRLGPPALVGLGLLALGLVLLVAPGWVGVGPVYGLPLGLLVLASGLAWLLLRLWPSGDDGEQDDEDDDGAVV